MGFSLAAALTALLEEQAFEVRLLVRLADVRVLVLRRPEAPALWLEAWPAPAAETAQVRKRMGAAGLRRRRQQPEGPRAFGVEFSHRISASALTSQVDSILSELSPQAGPGDDALSLSSQRFAPPQNPLLREAMRAAATTQDGPTRQRLYAALVNATLLVPIAPETASLSEAEQKPLALPEGTLFAFSDWDALRHWQVAGHPFGLVHGTDFFAHAAACDVGVQVNPEGTVGGVLYPAEVQMMADAVRRFLQERRDGGRTP